MPQSTNVANPAIAQAMNSAQTDESAGPFPSRIGARQTEESEERNHVADNRRKQPFRAIEPLGFAFQHPEAVRPGDHQGHKDDREAPSPAAPARGRRGRTKVDRRARLSHRRPG